MDLVTNAGREWQTDNPPASTSAPFLPFVMCLSPVRGWFALQSRGGISSRLADSRGFTLALTLRFFSSPPLLYAAGVRLYWLSDFSFLDHLIIRFRRLRCDGIDRDKCWFVVLRWPIRSFIEPSPVPPNQRLQSPTSPLAALRTCPTSAG